MNLIELLFLSVPAALMVGKLVVLVVAVVWAIRSILEARGLLPEARHTPVHLYPPQS